MTMAKRKMKRKSRRKQPVKLLNVAQGMIVGNALTQGFFNTNVVDFFTGMQNGKFNPGADGAFRITLPELLGFGPGGVGGSYGTTPGKDTFSAVVRANLGKTGVPMMMVGTVLLAPAAFRLGTRALGPLIRPVNKQLRNARVGVEL